MLRTYHFTCLLLLFTLFACGEKKVAEKEEVKIQLQPFLFNLQHALNEGDYSPSFPVWFNDSIVASRKLKRIIRRAYAPVTEGDSLMDELKGVYTYEFDDNGKVTLYSINSYYDNIEFGSVTFKYLPVKNDDSYRSYKKVVEKGQGPSQLSDHIEEYQPVESNERFLIYMNLRAGNDLLFMRDSEYWGPISIDTILHPASNDWVVLGDPVMPMKKYQVENTVKEFNVTEYEYDENGQSIKRIVNDKYPFIQSRNFVYDESGKCSGFIDSIFTDKKFLSRKVYLFSFDNTGLPSELHRKNVTGKEKNEILQKETFTYEYYD